MVIKQDNGNYYSTLAKREYADLGEARFRDAFYNYQKFIGYDYYAHDGDKVYIADKYLYKMWLIYLSLLHCIIHEDLIHDYEVFTDNSSLLSDTLLDNQTSVPELFMIYEQEYKGPGWYTEISAFRPAGDMIMIKYEKADNNPLSDFAMLHIDNDLHKSFGGF